MKRVEQTSQNKKQTTKSKSQTVDIAQNKTAAYLSMLIVFCVPLIIYAQTLSFGFTHFDDDGIITNHISFLSNFNNTFRAFANDAYIGKSCVFYRPLQTISYMIDIHISGADTLWMYHFSNVLLFCFIACALFLFLKRFSIPPIIALLSTVMYSVHPLFTSTVAWIPARGDLLLTLFSLLSFLFLMEHLQQGKIKFLLLHAISFTLALFCKETAAFLPFLFIMYYLLFVNEKRLEKRYVFTVLWYGITGIVWFWLRMKAIGDVSDRSETFEVGMLSFVHNLRSIPESITSFIFPFDVGVLPGFSTIKCVIGLLILAAITWLFFKNNERTPKEKLFCLAWILLLLLPTMMFRHVFIDYLNHRFLLPFIGMLLFVLFIIPQRWMQPWGTATKGLIVYGIVLCFFTLKDTQAFANPIAFYNAAIDNNPNSALAYSNRGNEKFQHNDLPGALADFKQSIVVNGNIPEVHMNCGMVNQKLGNYAASIINFNSFLHFRPKNEVAYNYKGMSVGSMGNLKEAICYFDTSITLNPKYYDAYGNRAIARYQIKDFKGAIDDCTTLLQLYPNDQRIMDLRNKAEQSMQK